MISQAFDLFKKGETGSFKLAGDQVLVATKNALVIRFYREYKKEVEQAILAARIGSQIVGNSSQLNSLQVHREMRNATEIEEQLFLSTRIPMIPFEVMKSAGLSLSTYQEIDSTGDETIYRAMQDRISAHEVSKLKADKAVRKLEVGKGEKSWNSETIFHDVTFERAQHFTGAKLFQVADKRFLLDIDRIEIQHGIVNPFLVQLQDLGVKTVAEAYQSLKPQEVIDAEASGLKVKRQGEWFFIPLDELTERRAKAAHDKRVQDESASESRSWARQWAGRGELRAGPNRPNTAEKMVEIDGAFFVSGTISHTGREHKDLKLSGFYRAIPNTSQTSWQITGDID